MWKRMLSGSLALVMSLMVAATPVLAAETVPQESQEEGVITELPGVPEEEATEAEASEEASSGETGSGEGETGAEAPEEGMPQEEASPEAPLAPEGERPLVAAGPVLRQEHVKYMGGFPDGSFQPDTKLTRAQAAQMIYRLLAQPESGMGACDYTDVASGAWYAQPVRALCALGVFDNAARFRPESVVTRAEFVKILYQVKPLAEGTAAFPDVPDSHWAASYIGAAASAGWIGGYPDGTFRPSDGLTRAEACTLVNRMLGRTGDAAQARKVMGLGLFSDVPATHWAAVTVAEAAVDHTPVAGVQGEAWSGVDLTQMTFRAGIHSVDGNLYYVDRYGKLAVSKAVGAYTADSAGALRQSAGAYQMADVPYISQIDNIYAWVGCEAVATLMGLKAKGYAGDVTVKSFLDNLPRTTSNPEKGFVGSPYVPDPSKRTRTTIYPAKLAEYSNTYCNGEAPCADFRGASVTDLQRELLAGNCVVGYMTLWWAAPYYRNYTIEGSVQRLVSNNHAVLVCGYDPDKGYFISDPYNYYNRGQVHQYWENAQTFEKIWNERKVGMVIR